MRACTILMMTVFFWEGIRFLTLERSAPNESPMREFSLRLPSREVNDEEILEMPRNRWSAGVGWWIWGCEPDANIVIRVISRTLSPLGCCTLGVPFDIGQSR